MIFLFVCFSAIQQDIIPSCQLHILSVTLEENGCCVDKVENKAKIVSQFLGVYTSEPVKKKVNIRCTRLSI